MKLIFSFSAFLAIVSASPCTDCTAVVNILANTLADEESIARQVEDLVLYICPEAEDADACVADLPDLWHRIAVKLWPRYYNPEEPSMCAKDGICGAPSTK